jgi:chitinase
MSDEASGSGPTGVSGARKLSIPRLMVAILVTAGLVAGSIFAVRWAQAAAEETASPWFAGYADVTATPTFAFEEPTSPATKNIVLSLVVADPSAGCTPSWGGAYSMAQASSSLDLDRRVARLQQQGGEIAISFGGQKNDELATTCTSVTQLAAAYRSVIDRYSVSTIDVDVEGGNLSDAAANKRRAEALALVQKQQAASGNPLAVWYTLPVSPNGLAPDGQVAVRDALAAHVELSGVNAMVMDYGSALPANTSMLQASESALTDLHRQLDALYRERKVTLSDKSLWARIGATPMIGQNDTKGEIFDLTAAKGLNVFVLQHGIGRVSMWSVNRDQSCGPNYVNLTVVSDACSGIDQGKVKFADVLGASLHGKPHFSMGAVTSDPSADTAMATDNPATSPYAIWSKDSAYLQGTKVVWHHNVYSAKWWTQGDTPDDPVLNDWQTPWLLIGPVLPGETPIPQPTLPAGTYPEWSGLVVFNQGDRVLFGGVPYQAKWWTKGDSPEASSSDPNGSPWVPLTLSQLQAVLKGTSSPGN